MVTLDYEKAAHLHRRAGFGASEDEIDALVGMDAGAAADRFLTFRASKSRTIGGDAEAAARSWLKRMLKKPPLQEKMTLFWHGHFATSIEKDDDGNFVFEQTGTGEGRTIDFRDYFGTILEWLGVADPTTRLPASGGWSTFTSLGFLG